MVKGIYNCVTLRTLKIAHRDKKSYPVNKFKCLVNSRLPPLYNCSERKKESDGICDL